MMARLSAVGMWSSNSGGADEKGGEKDGRNHRLCWDSPRGVEAITDMRLQ
jgi:hypothetical protein